VYLGADQLPRINGLLKPTAKHKANGTDWLGGREGGREGGRDRKREREKERERESGRERDGVERGRVGGWTWAVGPWSN